jgi:chemotaxis protein methyltransferase CheR
MIDTGCKWHTGPDRHSEPRDGHVRDSQRGPSVEDSEGVQFLQWCLPRLGLRWQGFRKVRKRVYKPIARRIEELGLSGLSAYRSHLDTHPDEWAVLDGFCRIPISRFYRDRGVFQHLEEEVLPELGALAVARGETELRCWSIGCSSGEEPYTLAIVWRLGPGLRVPDLHLRVLATDIDPENLARARRGCYSQSSLKDLPPAYLEQAFVPTARGWCLGEVFRRGVTFVEQDVRQAAPSGPFHLVLCRNVAFTYFDEGRQRDVLGTIVERLTPGGALVIGSGESLPEGVPGLEVWSAKCRVYRRR